MCIPGLVHFSPLPTTLSLEFKNFIKILEEELTDLSDPL
jgi:hypothetical protein